jgi:hypothetical protein
MDRFDLARQCRTAAARLTKFADQCDLIVGAGFCDLTPIKGMARFMIAQYQHKVLDFLEADAIPYAKAHSDESGLIEPTE